MRGRDKLAELVDGTPLLRRQALAALAVSSRVIVALPAEHPRAALLAGLPVTVLYPPEAAEGMGGSLRAGVAALPDCGRFMVLLADLPELLAVDLKTVLQAADDKTEYLIWRGATADGRPGHPIVFAATLRTGFAHLHGDSGGESLVAPLRDRTKVVRLPGERARRDLDTPEDWAAWRAETGR